MIKWQLDISMKWLADNDSSVEPHFKNVSNSWNTNISFYLETSGVQSYNLYLNVVNFFNTSVN
jgi:hypothetical protein